MEAFDFREKAVSSPGEKGQPAAETGEAYLDDITYIREMKHKIAGPWHQYDVLLEARGYGWDMMLFWADYMTSADLQNISQVTAGTLGMEERDITQSYQKNGGKCAQTPELSREQGMLSIAGISKTLMAPMKIVWINQTKVLRFFTTVGDDEFVSRYVETVIRQSFGTENAMKLGRPIPEVSDRPFQNAETGNAPEKTPSQLEKYVKKGYLKEIYSGNDFVIYDFLQLVHVGFLTRDNGEAPKGLLLRKAEADMLIHSVDPNVFVTVYGEEVREDAFMEFSQKLYETCGSAFGKSSIRRQLKKKSFWQCGESKVTPQESWGLDSFLTRYAFQTQRKMGDVFGKTAKTQVKKVKCFVCLTFACLLLFVLGIATKELRDGWNPNRSAAAFDQNGMEGIYASVELDTIAQYMTVMTRDPQSSTGMSYTSYYLYGNSKTGQIGVLMFRDAHEQFQVVDPDSEAKHFSEGITLYGYTKSIPYYLHPVEEKVEYPDFGGSGKTFTLTDGTVVEVPSYTVPTTPVVISPELMGISVSDHSRDALEYLCEKGFSLEEIPDLGQLYLETMATPEQEPLFINKLINEGMFVFLWLMLIFLGFAFVYAFKTDVTKENLARINNGKMLALLVESLSPVVFEGQSVHLRSGPFLRLLTENGNQERQCERRGMIPLVECEPELTLIDDGVPVRTYKLQTEDGESFAGKYFMISVRLGIGSNGKVITAQIDGYIADTPEEQEMTANHIGYRMEGYYLRSAGSAAEQCSDRLRGKGLVEKGLKYPGHITPGNVRLVGYCPACKKTFVFRSYAANSGNGEIVYSDDGLDACVLREHPKNEKLWSYEAEGKTFRYHNSFCCPHCKTPYIDYESNRGNKDFGVSGCVHLGRKLYIEKKETKDCIEL